MSLASQSGGGGVDRGASKNVIGCVAHPATPPTPPLIEPNHDYVGQGGSGVLGIGIMSDQRRAVAKPLDRFRTAGYLGDDGIPSIRPATGPFPHAVPQRGRSDHTPMTSGCIWVQTYHHNIQDGRPRCSNITSLRAGNHLGGFLHGVENVGVVRPRARSSSFGRVFPRMKELVRLIPAPDVDRRETGLEQDTGRQVAPLPDLAIGGDLTTTGEFSQARA